MHAREFGYACFEFRQYGKIKDIDFNSELYNEPLNGETYDVIIKNINFNMGTVVLEEEFRPDCDCCGPYFEDMDYDLDDLAKKGYFHHLLDRLGEVLNDKLGV